MVILSEREKRGTRNNFTWEQTTDLPGAGKKTVNETLPRHSPNRIGRAGKSYRNTFALTPATSAVTANP